MSRFFHQNRVTITAILLVVALFLCACGGTLVGNPESTSDSTITAKTFTDEDELEAYLKDQYAENILPYGTLGYAISNIVSSDTYSSQSEELDSLCSTEMNSGTNTQEQGVDESDKTKADGAYFYVAGEQKVDIVNAVLPDEMTVIHTIAVEGQVMSLYLYNNILAVLYVPVDGEGTKWTNTNLNNLTERIEIGLPYYTPVKAQLGLMLVDVSTPTDPVWIRQMAFDGKLAASRLINGKLHIIQQFLPDLPALELWYDGTEENRNEVIAANNEKLDALTLDDLLPSWFMIDGLGYNIKMGTLVTPENYYYPSEPSGGSIVTIVTIPLDDLSDAIQTKGMVADVHQIYASLKALYLFSNKLNYQTNTIDENYIQSAIIHKFGLTGNEAVYQVSGKVKGQILNPMCVSEYDDVLRIASTSWDTNSGGAQNDLFCLSKSNNSLSIIGSVENIAPGKNLYSARFLDTRGFLVFSGNMDPVFTLDLSAPQQPKIAGKLDVPGKNIYLHPFGVDHLIVLGRDLIEDDGSVSDQGIKLSLFNITNLKSPVLEDTLSIGNKYTDSEVFYDYKAFTFWAWRKLISFPVETTWDPDGTAFTGIYVFRASTPTGFETLGRISTSYSEAESNWTRSIFSGDSVYAVNENLIRSAMIDDIENTINELVLDH